VGFDLLSIDIEGHELVALSGFDFGYWQPRLVLIEDHVTHHQKHALMRRSGYQLILRTGLNSWYVPAKASYTFSWAARFEYLRKYYLGLPTRKFRYSRPQATMDTGERMTDKEAASAPPADPGPPLDVERVLLHMPVDIRNMSLVVLAGLAFLFVLHWAKAVFIPVMVGVLFSYALSPVVNWLETKRVPRWLGAAVLLCWPFSAASARPPIRSATRPPILLEALPAAAQKFRQAVKARSGRSDSALETVQKAAAQIEQAAQESRAPTSTRAAPCV
jgi:hypothetical protein